MKEDITIQTGAIIMVQNPTMVHARIYSEEQRDTINALIRHKFIPHHTAVGKGRSTKKHWNLEKYVGKYGKGFKMITTSPFSSNFNHLTYFLV